MHHPSSGVLLIATLSLAAVLAGCLGKSTPNPGSVGVRSVSLSPAGNISIEVGRTQGFSVTATDAKGHAVVASIQFVVTSGNPASPAPLSITSAGNACAGTWDQTFSMCHSGTPGIAVVTAVVNGVSSVPTNVYVHYHIDSLQVMPAQQMQPPHDCFSQGQTWLYQAIAYNSNTDITNTVGPLVWASTNTGVLTATPFVPPNQPNVLNEVQITADSPGITQLYASVSGTTSNSLPLTTCLVQHIRLEASGSTTNSISVNSGGSIALRATVVDTLGFTLTKPPLTWSTSNPEVASFSTVTNSTGANSATAHSNFGGATLTASCTPPTCNIGVLPGIPVPTAMPIYVFASNGSLPPPSGQQGFGAISVNVTTTGTLPTFSAWAATNQCQNAPGCTSTMFQITPGNTPIGSPLTVPRTPNSMMFNYQTRIYLGSDQGLMYVDVGGSSLSVTLVSSASTPCNVSLCGKVLAISNDGKLVVVGDDVSSTPQAYIYNSSNSAVTDLVLTDAPKVAAFSPDQSKVFLVTKNGTMYVYSTVNAVGVVPTTASPAGSAFSADGSFAYVVTTPPSSVTAFSMCAPHASEPSAVLGSIGTAGLPVQLSVSPVTKVDPDLLTEENILALEPPNIQVLTAKYKQTDIADGQFTCNPPTLNSLTAAPAINLGQGNFTPIYSRLVGNGSAMIILGQNVPAVLIFSVTNGTTTSIRLVNGAAPLSASSSSDGSTVYVAACDQYPNNDPTQPCAAGSVHIIDTISRGDYQQVPYINNGTNNMCNGLGQNAPLCIANLVAIKPQ